MTGTTSGARSASAELAYLTRAPKAPSLHADVERLGERPAPSPGPTRSSSSLPF
jgi:hypothetical protein